MRIQDNVFLITGGASGLGAAAAQALVEAGGKVVLVDLDETAAQATAHALGANAFSVVADIRDETAARHAVSAARERFGALHGLVNCAGVAGGEKVLGRNGPHSLDSFRKSATRWLPACHSRHVWGIRPNTPRWCGTSSRTACSTAR